VTVKEMRVRIAEVRETLRVEDELLDLSQQKGTIKGTEEEYKAVRDGLKACATPLDLLELALASKDPETDIVGGDERLKKIESGLKSARQLLLQAITGAKVGDA